MKKAFTFYILICGLNFSTNAQYPKTVQEALEQTKTNKLELIKALDYFYKTDDSLKIKSINFLISNMPLHDSYTYYWADSIGNRVAFNELDYATFNDAVIAFNDVKATHTKLHPVAYRYNDIDSVKGDYLINNIEQAIISWKARYNSLPTTNDGSLGNFLEYTLPYRVDVEPLENWRTIYHDKYSDLFHNGFLSDSLQLRRVINNEFKNLWSVETKNEPLPRLGSLQILLRGKGYCEDIADMATFIARSQGIPSSVDNIPLWATTGGNHFTNYIILDSFHTHFDAVLDSLGREPGKVVRSTYSAQADAVATWLDTSKIPSGFLRIKTYKDVTKEYWPVDNFSCKLFNLQSPSNKVAFLTVLNNGAWQPIWYGKIHNGIALFENMSRGVVYLPMYYSNNTLIPGGWPQALGYHNIEELKPDLLHTHNITIHEQEKYLKFRSGKRYRLFFWNNQWQLIGEQIATNETNELTFQKVPSNVLLILIPEYSQGKERPFIILKNGERVWF